MAVVAGRILLSMALATQGCSYVKSLWGSDDDSTDLEDAANANEGEPLPPPVANVAISYRRPGDALARATVIKFFGAEVIANHQRDSSRTESVVRFDGGVPIWEFKADEGTFGSLTGVGAIQVFAQEYRVLESAVALHAGASRGRAARTARSRRLLCLSDRTRVRFDELPGRQGARRRLAPGLQCATARGQQLPALLQRDVGFSGAGDSSRYDARCGDGESDA